VHPASHNTRIPISDAMVRLGTMCPVRMVGNPGIAMSQQCVDLTLAPSGRFIDSGFVAIRLLFTGIPSMMKMAVAPVSRIIFDDSSGGLSRTACVAFATLCRVAVGDGDLFDVFIVASSSSADESTTLMNCVGIRENSDARFTLSATFKFSAPTCQNPPGGGS